jgi:hypothetical protein
MADQEWAARQARYRRFGETELGALYKAYSRALIAYWQHDGDERISDKKLADLFAAANAAEKALVDKLMAISEGQ